MNMLVALLARLFLLAALGYLLVCLYVFLRQRAMRARDRQGAQRGFGERAAIERIDAVAGPRLEQRGDQLEMMGGPLAELLEHVGVALGKRLGPPMLAAIFVERDGHPVDEIDVDQRSQHEEPHAGQRLDVDLEGEGGRGEGPVGQQGR